MTLTAKPITQKAAFEYIDRFHRHHRRPVGWKVGIGVENDGKLVGVVVLGRPVARMADDGMTAEVTRLCTDGTKNACSFLYSRANRAAKAMGYTKVITYTLASESGASLRASGWKEEARVYGRSWSCESRPREDKHPVVEKIRWSAP